MVSESLQCNSNDCSLYVNRNVVDIEFLLPESGSFIWFGWDKCCFGWSFFASNVHVKVNPHHLPLLAEVGFVYMNISCQMWLLYLLAPAACHFKNRQNQSLTWEPVQIPTTACTGGGVTSHWYACRRHKVIVWPHLLSYHLVCVCVCVKTTLQKTCMGIYPLYMFCESCIWRKYSTSYKRGCWCSGGTKNVLVWALFNIV